MDQNSRIVTETKSGRVRTSLNAREMPLLTRYISGRQGVKRRHFSIRSQRAGAIGATAWLISDDETAAAIRLRSLTILTFRDNVLSGFRFVAVPVLVGPMLSSMGATFV